MSVVVVSEAEVSQREVALLRSDMCKTPLGRTWPMQVYIKQGKYNPLITAPKKSKP